MQVGDETEVLYLIAPTKTARDKWKEAFLKGKSISLDGSIEKLKQVNFSC